MRSESCPVRTGKLDPARQLLVSVLPVMVGMALGARIRPHVPVKIFRLMILLVVFASAADLILAPLLRSLA